MAITFGNKTPDQRSGLVQQVAPTRANALPLPSYYPRPGLLYGTNPALLNIALRRYLLEQKKRGRLGMGAPGVGGVNALGSRLANSRLRPGTGRPANGLGLGSGGGFLGGLGSRAPMPNPGAGNGRLLRNRPMLSGRRVMLAGQQNATTRGPARGMLRFRDSQGGIHDLPHESLAKALQRDPGLRILGV